MASKSRCAICKQSVYRAYDGKVLIHTAVIGGRTEVCPGWDRGARP